MSMFDDLRDPLGRPAGDALSQVMTRARRRRRATRGAAAAIAAVVVVTIAVSAGALRPSSNGVHIAGTNTTIPTARPSTSTSTSTSSTSAPSTTSTTTTTTPVASGGLWTDRQITITPRSLGQVAVGMTLDQAQVAAGLTFDGAADGAFYPTTLPAGFPSLFVNEGPDAKVVCVGAETSDPASNPQDVSTPEGFRLGETVQQLQAIYGSRLRYLPAPHGGISPRAGYVVVETDGNLAFDVDPGNGTIYGIKGGGSDLTPSSCNG